MYDKRIKLDKKFQGGIGKRQPERVAKILDKIKRGCTMQHACESEGISHVTAYYWTCQGELELRHGIEDTFEAKFVKALREIQAAEIMECRQLIRENEKGHTGAQWTLERAYWKQFSNNAPAMELAEDMELSKTENDQENSKDCADDRNVGRNAPSS